MFHEQGRHWIVLREEEHSNVDYKILRIKLNTTNYVIITLYRELSPFIALLIYHNRGYAWFDSIRVEVSN